MIAVLGLIFFIILLDGFAIIRFRLVSPEMKWKSIIIIIIIGSAIFIVAGLIMFVSKGIL
jgi:hypothetical protein